MSFPKTLALITDATDKANLTLLLNREEGTFFSIQKGKLRAVTGCCNRYTYWKNEQWKKVAKLVDSLMTKLNAEIDRKRAYGKEWKAIRNELKPIFAKNGTIGRLSDKIFDRKKIQGSSLDLITLADKMVRVKIMVNGIPNYLYVKTGGEDFVTPYHVDFDLGTDSLNHNLSMLLARKKGETFKPDSLFEHRLTKVTGLKNRLSYWWNRSETQGKVREMVESVVTAFNGLEETLADQRKLHVLRYTLQNEGAFTRLSEQVFNRGCIEEGSPLEKALMPDLQKSRERFELERNEKNFTDISYQEFLFAGSLGIKLEAVSTGGTGGARYGYSRYGKTMPAVWVIKPSDEGPNGNMNPSTWQRVKSVFISQRTSLCDNSEACSEVDAMTIDRALGLNIVPPTMRESVRSKAFYKKEVKECSLQMFVDGASTLKEHLRIPTFMHFLPRCILRWYYGRESKRGEIASKLPSILIERLAALNFSTEEFDCHLDNSLILLDTARIKNCGRGFFASGENQRMLRSLFHKVNGVTLIKHDNGSSNPHSHPEFSLLHPIETHLSQRYRYLFEVLPLCSKAFSHETIALMSGKEGAFFKALEDKAKLSLRSMTHPLEDKIFEGFWNDNLSDIRRWLFSEKEHGGVDLLNDLVARTNDELQPQYQNSPEIRRYFAYHLTRIRNAIQARIESYEVMLFHFEKTKKNSIRDLLTGVRYKEDFDAALKKAAKKPLHTTIQAARAAAAA